MRWMLMLALFGVGCSNNSSDVDTTTGDDDDDVMPLVPATSLAITAVAINQAVDVPLMEDGAAVTTTTAPPIAGRQALFRTYVRRGADWADRDLLAVLSLDNDGTIDTVEVTTFVSADSTDGDLNSTVNFEVDGALLTTSTRWEIDLYEADGSARDGVDEGSAYPSEGETQALNAVVTDKIRIVIIPIRYQGDGSDRLPDTGEEQIAALRAAAEGMYPASEVELTVDPVMNWSRQVAGTDQNAWGLLLNSLASSRQRDRNQVAGNTYYYGLFKPATSLRNYCGAGCILGLSYVGGPKDVWSRASIGVNFGVIDTANTFVHEVGHALGREHSPCGLYGQASDRNYPYSGATLDTWGYDITDGTLQPPNLHDVMSYCNPYWISDYTFNGIAQRMINIVNNEGTRGAPTPWSAMAIDGDGVVTWRGSYELDAAPGGRARSIELLDADGRGVGHTTGWFTPYSHFDGGMILYPQPGPGVVGARLAL